MGRERNVFQMKEQNKASEKELNKMEISNLPDVEFETLVIWMLNELRGRVDELSDNVNKEIENKKESVSNEEYNNWRIHWRESTAD